MTVAGESGLADGEPHGRFVPENPGVAGLLHRWRIRRDAIRSEADYGSGSPLVTANRSFEETKEVRIPRIQFTIRSLMYTIMLFASFLAVVRPWQNQSPVVRFVGLPLTEASVLIGVVILVSDALSWWWWVSR